MLQQESGLEQVRNGVYDGRPYRTRPGSTLAKAIAKGAPLSIIQKMHSINSDFDYRGVFLDLRHEKIADTNPARLNEAVRYLYRVNPGSITRTDRCGKTILHHTCDLYSWNSNMSRNPTADLSLIAFLCEILPMAVDIEDEDGKRPIDYLPRGGVNSMFWNYDETLIPEWNKKCQESVSAALVLLGGDVTEAHVETTLPPSRLLPEECHSNLLHQLRIAKERKQKYTYHMLFYIGSKHGLVSEVSLREIKSQEEALQAAKRKQCLDAKAAEYASQWASQQNYQQFIHNQNQQMYNSWQQTYNYHSQQHR